MKKLNTKVSKKIAVIVLTAVAAFSLMGCNFEKTVTTTTTETHTDADGNTTGTTTTTTTTNNNGKVTTETTTEDINEVEDLTDEEADVAFFEKVPLLVANEMGWDVAGITLKMSSSDEWSDNFLGDDLWLNNGDTMSGINVSYDEEDRFIDINVVDSKGEGVAFDKIELPVANNDEVTIYLEHNESDDSYHAYVACTLETDSWKIIYDTENWFGYMGDDGNGIINNLNAVAGTSLIEITEADVATVDEACAMLVDAKGKALTAPEKLEMNGNECYVVYDEAGNTEEGVYIFDFYLMYEHNGKVIIVDESITHDDDNERAELLSYEFDDVVNTLILK